MAVSPTNFYESIATFGADNDHFIRDLSTYNIAMGLALLVSVVKMSWRVPILFLVAVQYLLHALNHLLDINDADTIFMVTFQAQRLSGLEMNSEQANGGGAR